MPRHIVHAVHGDLQFLTLLVMIFLGGDGVVCVLNRLPQLPAMRFQDFDSPSHDQ